MIIQQQNFTRLTTHRDNSGETGATQEIEGTFPGGNPTFEPPNTMRSQNVATYSLDAPNLSRQCIDLDHAIMVLSVHYIGASQDERLMAFKSNATFIFDLYMAIEENLDTIKQPAEIIGYNSKSALCLLVRRKVN